MINTVLVPHMSGKIICTLDPMGSNTHTPFNRTIHTVIVVLCSVVPVERLLCPKGSWPRAIRGFTGKSAWGTCMRAAAEVMDTC